MHCLFLHSSRDVETFPSLSSTRSATMIGGTQRMLKKGKKFVCYLRHLTLSKSWQSSMSKKCFFFQFSCIGKLIFSRYLSHVAIPLKRVRNSSSWEIIIGTGKQCTYLRKKGIFIIMSSEQFINLLSNSFCFFLEERRKFTLAPSLSLPTCIRYCNKIAHYKNCTNMKELSEIEKNQLRYNSVPCSSSEFHVSHFLLFDAYITHNW